MKKQLFSIGILGLILTSFCTNDVIVEKLVVAGTIFCTLVLLRKLDPS